MSDNITKPIGVVSVTNYKCILSKKYESKKSIGKAIAKVVGIKEKDEFLFAFQVSYKGNLRLEEKDILFSKNGIRFMVQQEQNHNAVLLCAVPLSYEPQMNETFKVYRD